MLEHLAHHDGVEIVIRKWQRLAVADAGALAETEIASKLLYCPFTWIQRPNLDTISASHLFESTRAHPDIQRSIGASQLAKQEFQAWARLAEGFDTFILKIVPDDILVHP